MRSRTVLLYAVAAMTAVGAATAAALAVRAADAPAPTPRWTKMPLLTPAAKQAGVFPGGEGAQWPRAEIAVSPADPDFLLLPIDVGGLYRSLDGGKHWEMALVGWNARGANGFAIDPKNARRVIGIAGNSLDWNADWGLSPHGLYRSTDKASSWRHVLAIRDGIGGVAAYDASSFDPARGFCVRAYFLSPRDGLFRTDDGGATWAKVAVGEAVTGRLDRDWTQGGTINSQLRVHPKTGRVFVGGGKGLWKSDDRGRTWTRLLPDDVHGLDLSPTGGALYLSGTAGIRTSGDDGRTWATLPAAGLDTPGGKPVERVAVSPADPKRLLCWVAGDNWKWVRYVSHDGGATFAAVKVEPTPGAILPQNARQGYQTWHPADPNVAWGLGGDWATKSTDGGRTFRWSNNGYNGVMVGGLFTLNAHTPDVAFLAFQDYNAAFTADGGRTWNYRDASGKGWGGHCYGGHAAAGGRVLFYGDSEGWGPPRRLRISRDGGDTWTFVPGPDGKPLEWKGAEVSYSDPREARVLFSSDLRSTDGGDTWARMDGCEGVYTADPATGALYGREGNAVVRSRDHGATWERAASEVEGGFGDLAVDHKGGRLYVASQDRLKVWDGKAWATVETPRNQYGGQRVSTVAVDPADPRVVYVGGPNNTFTNHATVCRSTDGGATWRNLTVNTPLGRGVVDGPHEVSCVRVHPRTREAWVAGQCFGMWRIAPPTRGEKGVPAEAASAPRAVAPPAPRDLTAAGAAKP